MFKNMSIAFRIVSTDALHSRNCELHWVISFFTDLACFLTEISFLCRDAIHAWTFQIGMLGILLIVTDAGIFESTDPAPVSIGRSFGVLLVVTNRIGTIRLVWFLSGVNILVFVLLKRETPGIIQDSSRNWIRFKRRLYFRSWNDTIEYHRFG